MVKAPDGTTVAEPIMSHVLPVRSGTGIAEPKCDLVSRPSARCQRMHPGSIMLVSTFDADILPVLHHDLARRDPVGEALDHGQLEDSSESHPYWCGCHRRQACSRHLQASGRLVPGCRSSSRLRRTGSADFPLWHIHRESPVTSAALALPLKATCMIWSRLIAMLMALRTTTSSNGLVFGLRCIKTSSAAGLGL